MDGSITRNVEPQAFLVFFLPCLLPWSDDVLFSFEYFSRISTLLASCSSLWSYDAERLLLYPNSRIKYLGLPKLESCLHRNSKSIKMVQGGMKCIKYLLFLFNLVFVIFGIVLIGVGVSVKVGFKPYIDLVDTAEFSTPPNLFIGVGVIVFFIAFLGCWGAVRENHCMIMTYSVLVGLLLVIELGAAFAAFALQDDVERLLGEGLNRTQHRYSTDPADKGDVDVTKSWDLLQHNLHCCGTHNFTDWGTIISAKNATYEIPQSCCLIDHVGCNNKTIINVHTPWDEAEKVIYTEGCWEKAVNDISIRTIGIVGITLAVVELLGVICACFLARSIRYSYETV